MPAAPRVKLPVRTGGGSTGRGPTSPANPGSRGQRTPADPILRLAQQQKRQLSDTEMGVAQQLDADWQRLVAVPLAVELTRFANRYQQALDALLAQQQQQAEDDQGSESARADAGGGGGGSVGVVGFGGGPRGPDAFRRGVGGGGASFVGNTGGAQPAPPPRVPTTWLLDRNGGDAPRVLRRVKEQIGKFAQSAQPVIAQGVASAQTQGTRAAETLLGALLQPGLSALDDAGAEGDAANLLKMTTAAARDDAQFALLQNLLQSGSQLGMLLGGMPQEAADQAYRTLLYGLGHGENPKALVSDLQQIMQSPRNRALTISRTEMMNSYRRAQIDSYRANDGVVQGWVWSSDMASACPLCVDLNGEIHPLDDDMVSHPRCFPAGTIVSGPRAVAGTERYYAGRLVEVVTAGGKRLSVTPNHPILTAQGWVAAGDLVEGDEVVSTRGSEGPLGGIRPDDYQIPAFIEDVAHAPSGALSVTTRSMPTAAEDFHGDGGDGEVRIVRPDGELRRGLQAALSQPVRELTLCRRHEALRALAGLSTLAQFLETLPPSACSIMGSAGTSKPFLSSRATRPQAVRLTAIADRDAGNLQAYADNPAADTVGSGEGKFGLTGNIAPHDLLIRDASVRTIRSGSALSGEASLLGERAQEAALLERLGQTLLSGVEASSDDLHALTSDICLDRVLEVSIRDFNGHVYNLETTHGWYVANGIIAHNCRCAALPITKSWDDILGPLGIDSSDIEDTTLNLESGEDWFARQDEATQRAVLGPSAFNAYQGGALQLSDLVGRNADGSYYQKSLKEAGLDFREYLYPAKSVASEAESVAQEAQSAGAQEVAKTAETAAAETEAEQIARDAFSIAPLPADVLEAEQAKAMEAIYGATGGDSLDAAVEAKARVSQELADRLKDNPEFAKVRDVLEQQYRESYALRNLTPEQVDERLAELLTPENVTSSLLKSWASGDAAYFPMQQAVREEFGLTGVARMPGTKDVREALTLWKDAQPGLRAFVREMYNNTQDWFKANNITELALYRGMGWAKLPKSIDASLFNGEAQAAQVALRAASSFSVEMQQAVNFANNPMSDTAEDLLYQQVIAARVPAELILSTSQTGFGALDEYEAVVLGGQYDVMSIGVDNSGYYKGPNSYINSLDAVHEELTEDQIFALLAQEAAGGE